MLQRQHTQNAPKIILKDTGTDTKVPFVMIFHKKQSRKIVKCIVYTYTGCSRITCQGGAR